MFWPCETRTSTCRSFETISSGLYCFLAIAVLLDVKDIPQVGPLQWGWISADLAMTEHPASWLRARPRLGHFRFRHLGYVFRLCFRRLPRCSIQVTERVGPSGVQVPATAIVPALCRSRL